MGHFGKKNYFRDDRNAYGLHLLTIFSKLQMRKVSAFFSFFYDFNNFIVKLPNFYTCQGQVLKSAPHVPSSSANSSQKYGMACRPTK